MINMGEEKAKPDYKETTTITRKQLMRKMGEQSQ